MLGADRLRTMLSISFAALAIGDNDAVLIAFDQTSSYDSPNFTWFRTRFPRFVYIDRVIVAPARQGRGYAAALYRRIGELASEAGHTRLGCEVNIDPPNPASSRFHARLGFVEVDRARVAGADKTVSRLSRSLEGFSRLWDASPP